MRFVYLGEIYFLSCFFEELALFICYVEDEPTKGLCENTQFYEKFMIDSHDKEFCVNNG